MPYVGPPMTGRYLELLARIHEHSRPRTYLEIGMRNGESLALARPETMVIGIDPLPTVWNKLNADVGLYFETSDDFFATNDVRALLHDQPVDLAFIDGMHLFEYALRDFRNVERCAGPDSVIMVHDCLPPNAEVATRERQTALWTGDTWKLVCCLAELRPDLDISTVAVKASGLAIIRNLDPLSTVLFDRYDEAIERFQPLGFEYIDGRQQEMLHLVANTPEVIERLPVWPAAASRAVPAAKRYPLRWPVLRYQLLRNARLGARRAQRVVTRSGSST
jgi:hypothetical protein